MKRKLYLFVITLLGFYQATTAQVTSSDAYYHHVGKHSQAAIPSEGTESSFTGQSGTGANMDVVYHRIWWRINPDSATKSIKGVVTTYFKTLVNNVSSITFDLRQSAFNNVNLVVTYHGTACTRTVSASNILTITLPSTIAAANTLDSVTIAYQGNPPAVSGAAEGYQKTTYNATTPSAVTQNYIYTLSESYEDRDWWPCKADMQDKIDSMTISVNVPWSGADTFWVATNGKLIDSTISASSRTYTFKNTYPMASYLVSVAVARYNRYYRTVNVGGTDTQVAFYLFRGKSAATYTNILNAMDIQTQVLTAFSNKFGDYPYKRDKHGFYEGLGGAGGMEHQTFSAIATSSLTSQSTLAHELMHQWFGDKATFATWADIYLAEGFARYGEGLAGELVPATGINQVSEMSAAKTAARSITTTPTRITSFTTSNQVWAAANISAMYDRGCMVVSMLRKLSGDNLFFQACRNYLDSANGSGYKSATTDSLKNNFSRVMGNYDLTPFFNDWVLGTGHPTTVINWTKLAANTKRLVLSVGSQTRSAGSSVSYFHNVIVLRVQGALPANDTLITFYDIDGNNLAPVTENGIQAAIPGNTLIYNLSFVPTTVTFDPYNQTMSAGSTVQLAALAVDLTSFTAQKGTAGNDIKLTVNADEPISKVILERSADGVHFTAYAEMQLAGTAGTQRSYQYTDMSPYDKATFYRAKIYTVNNEKYSGIAKVQQTAGEDVTISPNPANDAVTINFANSSGEKVTIRIISAEGKVIMETATKNNFIHYDTQRLPAGTYIMQVIKQGQVSTAQKFAVYH